MSESFFFACVPRYLRVQHSFAKGIKPNTKYRVAIFKGIQKSDEMKQSIKSKIVGGKIDLQSHELFFNIPFYNPTKNIHFNLKVYEQKPNQDETQIGSYTIVSSDYIKIFKNQNKIWHNIEGMIKDDLFCVFDLLVEKSKFALTDELKNYNATVEKVSKQIVDDNASQSSRSRQAVRERQGFLSPRKRLQRKNGRVAKLRSRNSSRSDGQRSEDGSVSGSRRILRKSPPTGRQERFQSPKRLSPAKNTERQKSIPKSDISDNKIETQSQAIGGQKPYKYQPKPQKQSFANKPQIARSNIVSNTSAKEVKSPVSMSHSVLRQQSTSQLNDTQPLSPRSPVNTSAINNSILPTSPKSVTQSAAKITKPQTIPSVSNTKLNKTEFQFKSTEKVFDIVKKKEESIIEISAEPQQINEKDQKLIQQKVKSKISNAQKQQENQKSIKNRNLSEKSEKTLKSIEVKQKQIKRDKSLMQSERIGVSSRLVQNRHSSIKQTSEADKLTTERKNKIIYAVFLVVSAFLIYNAMMPTRRT